jgi:hypothetical protein
VKEISGVRAAMDAATKSAKEHADAIEAEKKRHEEAAKAVADAQKRIMDAVDSAKLAFDKAYASSDRDRVALDNFGKAFINLSRDAQAAVDKILLYNNAVRAMESGDQAAIQKSLGAMDPIGALLRSKGLSSVGDSSTGNFALGDYLPSTGSTPLAKYSPNLGSIPKPYGGSGGAAQPSVINVDMTVHAVDASSFMASKEQIQQDMFEAAKAYSEANH